MKILLAALVSSLTIASVDAVAEVLMLDPFNDEVLDVTWEVELVNASAWSGGETDSLLLVEDIAGLVNNQWAQLVLRRDFGSLGDFDLELELGWDSGGVLQAMQKLSLDVLSPAGTIASIGYGDAWVGARGGSFGHIGQQHWSTGLNSLPYAGQVTVGIRRENGLMQILWDDSPVMSREQALAVSHIEINFSRFLYPGAFLGALSVDRVLLSVADGVPSLRITPVEADSLMLIWTHMPASAFRVFSSPAPYAPWPGGWQLEAALPGNTRSLRVHATPARQSFRVTREQEE